MSSMKPISSILSASSSTTWLTLSSSIVPLFKWSMSLPGVATTTWAPLSNRDCCWPILTPPKMDTTRIEVYFEYFVISWVTWTASSRVGTNIKNCTGPLFLRRDNTGKQKAAVLPVPVCAWPITSCPCKINGIDASWIGNGLAKPISSNALVRGGLTPNSSNVEFNLSFH